MPRGIYERPEGSGIWWILYYVGGKRRRERVGRKSDAIKLYQSRKADCPRRAQIARTSQTRRMGPPGRYTLTRTLLQRSDPST
jgi:hypothetical protein